MKQLFSLVSVLFSGCIAFAQSATTPVFVKADTLRGSVTPERVWWDVQRYDLSFTPDYINKSLYGCNAVSFKVKDKSSNGLMQIDLKEPLQIDSIILGRNKLSYYKKNTVWYVVTNALKKGKEYTINIYYQGKVHEAVRPPWDGGFTFTTDSVGRPWMTVTCQGEAGASIWYPCKDHQSDEPDKGASLTITVADTLVAIANGRMEFKHNNNNGTATYKWSVVNPINNYCLIPYIGKYVNFYEQYKGLKGILDLNYWVLDYNLEKAKLYMPDQVHKMLNAFEYWFGPYPFYEDGYKLIETSNTGMEHQSAVSYGNWYEYGYRGRDISYSGWGLQFDFIIIHESGHEWFGNNITTADLADMWVHEGFTNYSETLFVDYIFGEQAGNEYNYGSRKGIQNDRPIIPAYNVNAKGSGDMYPKAGNMLHSIRHSLNNDSLFRKILRGLNKVFYHQVVTSRQVQEYISQKAGFNFKQVFAQYLTTTQIPRLEFYFTEKDDRLHFRYTNCVKGFNLPIVLKSKTETVKLFPEDRWKEITLSPALKVLFQTGEIQKLYYVNAVNRNDK
ncbi:M1 family metallopeptidase [Lacibacter sp.]|uniref:M1 family metallopeptidase n=1 Tax=Lacibacter sp. TaxID=1915409 RepID=UPI002B4B66CB|nr:M1 family metallopeptidase [Lacibacter sp.]HLP37628.1 M1 family metallopeptidase [Lacibacter sp.]